MSALTKTHRTEIKVTMGNKEIVFSDVPKSKINNLVISLKEYRQKSIPWRNVFDDKFAKNGGENACMLRASREREGLSQSQLADKLGMPQSNISQIEHGKRPIGKGLAKRLSKIFKVDYRVFL